VIRFPDPRGLVTYTLLTGLLPLVAAGSVSGGAHTSSAASTLGPQGATVTVISRGTTEHPFELKGPEMKVSAKRRIDVAVVQIALEPGGHTGWHTHLGQVVATVTAGQVTRVTSNCSRHTYTAGESFVEERRDLTIVRNTGDDTATVVGTFLVPVGATALTPPAPAPLCAAA
jgi:quercetin dioxygenase-like cupin family protein